MKHRAYTQLSILIIIFIFLTSHMAFANQNKSFQQDTAPIPVSIPVSYYLYNPDQPLSILYPRSSIPAIVETGQQLLIQFQSTPFDSLIATIETAYDALPDTISLPVTRIEQQNQTSIAYATIPEQTPEELYNLTLTIVSEGQSYSRTRPRAVSVNSLIDGNFTFIHVADFHIGDPRGLKEHPKEIIGWKASRKIIEEINLLHPDFVIISGDLTFGQLYPFEYTIEYKKCYEILQEFQVPTFLCPGNHDGYVQTGQDGFHFWQKYFGPLYYSFDYGPYHFINVNSYDWPKIARFGISYLVFNWGGSIGNDQLQWIEQDLKNNQGKNICINLHHNPLWDTTNDSLLKNGYNNREDFLELINRYKVEAVFAGHVHYDNISMVNTTLFITTTTASSGIDDAEGYWGYRQIYVNNDSITSYNYKEPRFSIPSYHIHCSFLNDTSMNIENDLEKEISVLVEFIVPNNEYNVENGEITQIRIKEDMAAYYVTSTVNPNSTQTIRLL